MELETVKASSSRTALESFAPEVDVLPISIYLYYIKPDFADPSKTVKRAYFYFQFYRADLFTEALLKNEFRDLVANAHDDGTDPAAHGTELSDLVWRRKGYVVFAIDAGGNYVDQSNPITFTGKDGNDGKHTFTAASRKWSKVEVYTDQSGPTDVEIVYAYNDMKNVNGQPLTDKELFTVTVNPKTSPAVALSLPDTGGTNLGPPVPPPAG